MKQKILTGYSLKVTNVEYSEIDVDDGYQCGCGGDDHEIFDELHGCKCYCHGGKGD